MKKIYAAFMLVMVAFCSVIGLSPGLAKASATATIAVSPSSGSHVAGAAFDVTISVSGGGQAFTTFGADVALSNLTIVDLNLGTGVSQCTTSPSKTSPSFYCGVAGSSNGVDVYTMSVKGTAEGAASITLTSGSVLQSDGYTNTEIFSSVTNGAYTITASSTSTTTTTTTTPQAGPEKEIQVGKPLTLFGKITNIVIFEAIAMVLALIYASSSGLFSKNKK